MWFSCWLILKKNFLSFRVGIEHTHQEETAAYVAATITKPKPAPETVPEAAPPVPAAVDSDSDSSG